ncbi:MAG: glycosyltransferase [Alphaproteobacteria bacterium]
MNILYLGNVQGFVNAKKYYFIPQRLINGFTRLGHNVYAFNDRDYARYSNILRSQKRGKKKLNEKVIEFCKEYQPDLIILGHCKNITNDTLSEIRKHVKGVKIAYRNVDPLSSEKNVEDIMQRVGHVDSIFITTAGDSLNKFSNNAGGVYFMPNPVDPALDTRCAFKNSNADIDVLFLASFLRDQYDHRHITAKYLLQNKEDLTIQIGGAGINENRIYGKQYFDMLERSKMGLCINKTNDYYLYASDRMSQYMAAGLLSFIPAGPQFEDIFDNDSFISFDTNEDLMDKIKYFSQHSEQRIKIAQTGYNKINDYFHADKVCQYIIETTFDKPLSQEYNWPTNKH